MPYWKFDPVNAAVLGTRIRQARERLGISQEELAILVKKDQRAISEYESGKRKLAAVDLPSFARVLQIPLLYFFEGDPSADDLEHILLQEFQHLPSPEAKQAAIDMMRVFSGFLHS